MFKNRSFLVKVVKDPEPKLIAPPKPEDVKSDEPFDYDKFVQTIAQASLALILVYMGADTLRKILVHVVATKIN